MAKRAASRLTVSELVAEASEVSREAWRACWLPILLVAAGHTLLFLNGNLSQDVWRPGPYGVLAYGLMIFYVPLYGGLFRVAIGGRPAAGRGPGGLQWNGVEWRLIAVGVVVAFLSGLSLVAFLAATGVLDLVLGSQRVVSLGPFGNLPFVAAASLPVGLLFTWLMAPRIARLMLGWAYSTALETTEPFGGWRPAKGSGWAIAWGLVLAWIPLLLGYLAIYAVTLIEGDALTPNAWPLPEALGAGALLGVLQAAVVAPLLVGVLTGAYWLLEDRPEGELNDREQDAAAAAADSAPAAATDSPADPPAMVYGEACPPDDADRPDDAADAAVAYATPPEPEPERGPERKAWPPRLYAVEMDPPAPEPAAGEPAAQEPVSQEPVWQEPLSQAHGARGHGAPDYQAGLSCAPEAAAAAAIAGVAALAAREAEKARPEAAQAKEPRPAATPEPVHRAEFEPLSPWPHSVLPLWPVRESAPRARFALAGARPDSKPEAESRLDGGAEAFPPLARRNEPAHRFVEITELK